MIYGLTEEEIQVVEKSVWGENLRRCMENYQQKRKHWNYPRSIKMDRREELRNLAKRIAKMLKEKYKVKRVFLIGSLVKRYIHESSDIDLMVERLAPEVYITALTEAYDILPPGIDLNLIPFENAFSSL